MGETLRVGDDIVNGLERAGQYGIDVDGEVVLLTSLPPGVFGRIETATGWLLMRVVLNPIGRADIASMLVDAAYKKCGKAEPNLADIPAILRHFVELESDLPDPHTVEGDVGENPTVGP